MNWSCSCQPAPQPQQHQIPATSANLPCSSQQHWVLNPLSKARDPICIPSPARYYIGFLPTEPQQEFLKLVLVLAWETVSALDKSFFFFPLGHSDISLSLYLRLLPFSGFEELLPLAALSLAPPGTWTLKVRRAGYVALWAVVRIRSVVWGKK